VLARAYDIALRTAFRGILRRQGLLIRGEVGWGEWSPFLDYSGEELMPWWRAAWEAAEQGWPEPERTEIAVNCTVPAVGPDEAYALVSQSGCSTAKVKVAERGRPFGEDLARVEAVRAALGPSGRMRLDANGAWSLDQAVEAILALDRFELEYVEQPCATVEELADLRRQLVRRGRPVPIAADESIRRAEDPLRVARLEAADIAVLKVQPLGGVRASLQIAERIGLPVVVSSALETSIGLRAGLALAAALPELPFACGLNTTSLLAGDLVAPALAAVDGVITLRNVEPDQAALERHRADPSVAEFWQARLVRTRELSRG